MKRYKVTMFIPKQCFIHANSKDEAIERAIDNDLFDEVLYDCASYEAEKV